MYKTYAYIDNNKIYQTLLTSQAFLTCAYGGYISVCLILPSVWILMSGHVYFQKKEEEIYQMENILFFHAS